MFLLIKTSLSKLLQFLLPKQLYPATENILSTGVEDAGMHKIPVANIDQFGYIFSILIQ